MRVAIYHPWVYLKSGLERTILELKRRSRHNWTIYTSHYDRDNTYPELKQMGVVELDRVSVKRSYMPVVTSGLKIALSKLDLSPYGALFICCDGLGSFIAFRNHSRPVINLCFTPLRAVYDMEYRKRHMKKHSRLLPLAMFMEMAYRRLDKMAWKKYSHVFCISDTVRRRVLDGGLAPESLIEIAYPGIDEEKISPSAERENFFFLPGRIMWTKNIELGIEAFLDFRKRHAGEFRLVIAGMVDDKSRPYFEGLKELARGEGDISFLVGPSDEEMERLYRTCYAVLFTAFNEDYGLTPLEGMSKAKPVIAVNRGGPTEVVVDGSTGLLVDCDPVSFSRAMTRLAENPAIASGMGEAGLERCRNFTWGSFVERIDAYLDRLEGKANG